MSNWYQSETVTYSWHRVWAQTSNQTICASVSGKHVVVFAVELVLASGSGTFYFADNPGSAQAGPKWAVDQTLSYNMQGWCITSNSCGLFGLITGSASWDMAIQYGYVND